MNAAAAPRVFEPSREIASPNATQASPTMVTRADHTYPFCEPSSRNNTTLDFYHLLLADQCSRNSAQVFTNLGTQLCGDFMRRCDATRHLGACVSVIYRSWAFVQSSRFEEFRTDDGLAYWYDRGSGETFWEKPLDAKEEASVMDGGVRVDDKDDSRDKHCAVPQRKTHEVRKLVLRHHETEEETAARRTKAAAAIDKDRRTGTLPDHHLEDILEVVTHSKPVQQTFTVLLPLGDSSSRSSPAATAQNTQFAATDGFDTFSPPQYDSTRPSPQYDDPTLRPRSQGRPASTSSKQQHAAPHTAESAQDSSSRASELASTFAAALLPARPPRYVLKTRLAVGLEHVGWVEQEAS